MAEREEPGLNPYQPNQRRKPPMTPTVKSCGNIGAPPSRLNLRPILGPRQMPPASAIHPPIECTTVEPAKSWKFIPKLGRKCVNALGEAFCPPIVVMQPSGPQA